MATTDEVRGLDDYQRAAVAHDDGPAIVRAGPGSGKTRVIAERAVRLIDDSAARPEELLVLTFSRKAAGELRSRIADRLRRSYASFPVTTFHGFCYSLLLRHAPTEPRLGRPAERQELMRHALGARANLGLPPTSGLVEEALAFAALCDDYLHVPDHPLARVRAGYVAALAERGAVDYGGLQREAVALLEGEPATRAAYQDAFRHVLVDEYQDTNVAQDRLLELLAGQHRNVFVVADEDQSIYGFRGAEIENALGFEDRWGGAARYDLPTNYRSAPRVVELATSVIRRNVDTHVDKRLAAAHDRPANLTGRTFRHPAQETDWIAREIAALRLAGTELGGIAILARSLREVGPRLAYALRTHGIPFHAPLAAPLHPTADGLLTLLELSAGWDDERALRVLASPLFAADPLELRNLRRCDDLRRALREAGEFAPLFEALAILGRQRSPGGAVYALWDRLDSFRDLQRRCRPLDAPHEDVEELEAVTAVSDAANDFEGGLADFAASYRSGALAAEDALSPGALPPDAVALLTVHQAKGLEWDAVFVCDLVEGRFPALTRSQYALFDRDAFASRSLDEAERARRALEEERRLFYVAITRARARLYLSATEEGEAEAGRSLSRFYLEAQSFLDGGDDGRPEFASTAEALAALRRAGGGPPGWRDRAPTPNEQPMLPDGGLWSSASRLQPYENCPLQFLYGSLLELRRVQTAQMSLGAVFHDILETFHSSEAAEQTRERLLELADEHWETTRIRPAALAAEQRRVLDRMLVAYHDLEVAAGRTGEVLRVEQRFRFALDGATISGYIDRIDRRTDGRLRLVDYKTGKRAMTGKEAAADLQLALYALACHQVDELAELGDVAEVVYLYPRRVARDALTRVGQDVTPALLETTRERVRGLIARIVAEEFDFSSEADCHWCDFKRLCPRHFGGGVPV